MKKSKGDIIISSHGNALACLFHKFTEGNFSYTDFQKMQMPDMFATHFDDENKIIQFGRYF